METDGWEVKFWIEQANKAIERANKALNKTLRGRETR